MFVEIYILAVKSRQGERWINFACSCLGNKLSLIIEHTFLIQKAFLIDLIKKRK